MLEISPIGLDRFDDILPIIEEVMCVSGYTPPTDLGRAEAMRLWNEPGQRIFAARAKRQVHRHAHHVSDPGKSCGHRKLLTVLH